MRNPLLLIVTTVGLISACSQPPPQKAGSSRYASSSTKSYSPATSTSDQGDVASSDAESSQAEPADGDPAALPESFNPTTSASGANAAPAANINSGTPAQAGTPQVSSTTSPSPTVAPTVAPTCPHFPRTPVNDTEECGEKCRTQLKAAAESIGIIDTPSDLKDRSVARDFYNKIRQEGAAKGCDPLRNTSYNG